MEKAKSSCFASAVVKDQTFEGAPEEVPCPVELKHVWDWFIELDATRQVGMGLNAISFTEIQAWSNLMKIDLKPFEVEAIRRLDMEYMKHKNSEDKKDG